jgi:transposase
MHRNPKEKTMPSNNSKYTEEFREQTAKMVIETGKSATSTAEEMGIDTNTVCRWVRDYRRKYNLPTYAEEKGIRSQPPKDSMELKQRIKDLEAKLKEKDKEIEKQKQRVREEQEKIEILKKSLHIFMQAHE